MPQFLSWNGRLRRGQWIEQWLFLLIGNLCVGGVIAALGFASDRARNEAGSAAVGVAFLVFLAAAAVLMSFPTVKRFHDLDSSGFWFLLFLIPGINVLLILPCMFLRGTAGSNRYGPDPLRADAARFLLDNHREQVEAAFPGLDQTSQERVIEDSIEKLFRRSLDEHPESPELALTRASVHNAALALSSATETAAGREFWIKLWSSVESTVY